MKFKFILPLAFFAFTSTLCWSQTADQLVLQGRVQLGRTNYLAAQQKFGEALSLQPNHESAHVLRAFTRLALLPQESPGSNFLTRLGFPVEGRQLWNWTSSLPSDTNGVPFVVQPINTSEFMAMLRTNLLPAIQASAADLATVTNQHFLLLLSEAETHVSDVLVDYGDLQILQAGLSTLEYFVRLLHAHDWSVQLEGLRSLYEQGMFSLEQVLKNHPELLTFASTNDLLAARQAFERGVDRYLAGSSQIRNRIGVGPARLFNLDWNDLEDEARFRCTLMDLRASLAFPVVLCTESNLTVSLARQFSGEASFRSMLPRFKENQLLAGTLPDPTFGGILPGMTLAALDTWISEQIPVATWFVDLVSRISPYHVLHFNTITGRCYAVEFSTNLLDWTEITNFRSSTSTYILTNTWVGNPVGYFRLHDLAEYVSYQGMVTDRCSGQPVPGAVVRESLAGHSSTAGATGRFSLQTRYGEQFGPFTFQVSAPGYVPNTFDWYFARTEQNLHFDLIPTHSPPPPNDRFADRIALSGLPLTASGTTCGATRETGEPWHLPLQTGLKSIWWTWTAPASGDVWIQTSLLNSSLSQNIIAVYTNSSLADLRPVTYGDANRRAVFYARSGTAYQIAVAIPSALHEGPVQWRLDPYASTPKMTLLNPLEGAVYEAPATFAIGVSLEGVSASAQVNYHMSGSSWYEGGRLSSPGYSTLLSNVPPGDYSLNLNYQQSGQIYLHTNIAFHVRPSNDDFAKRQIIPPDRVSVPATTRGASHEPQEPAHAGAPPLRSVWWSWTAPFSGPAVIAALGERGGRGLTNRLAVYTGASLSTLTPIASHLASGETGFTPVSFSASAGVEYQIALDTLARWGENYALTIGRGIPPTVEIRAPADGTRTSLEVLTVEAAASDEDGSIERVEFYNGRDLLALVSQPPYSLTWNNLPYGPASYWAAAVDNSGLRGVSSEVEVWRIPANDDLANASHLDGAHLAILGSNQGATLEAGEKLWTNPNYPGGASVWWRWTAPFNGMATLSAQFIDQFWNRIALGAFVGSALSDLTSLARVVSSSGEVETTFLAESGKIYWIAVDSAYGYQGSFNLELDLQPTIALETALDATNVIWSTSGHAPWVGQAAVTRDGEDAAASGPLAANQQSILEARMTGPGVVHFWCKVTSESGGDYLDYFLDGIMQDRIFSGNNWQQRSNTIPSGSHTMRWLFKQDGTARAGQDGAWIDQVAFTPPIIPPSIITQPASVELSPGEKASFTVAAAGSMPLFYQWRKDTMILTNGGRFSGVDTPTLTISNVTVADAGGYSVQVSNLYGSTHSAAALLTGNMANYDVGFRPFASASVSSLAIQTDGKIIAGGDFISLGLDRRKRYHLGRLETNGAPDGFDPGVSGNSSTNINSLALQADGKLLVGGDFSSVGGERRNNICRLNADGTLDNGFNPDANASVNALVIQTDGKILVGGNFTILGGQPRERLARLNVDGTLDEGFNPGASGWIHTLALQADGKILAGGSFSQLGGHYQSKLGRLNPDGTPDGRFRSSYCDSTVRAIVIQADEKILVGGDFTQIAGRSRHRIGRLKPDGTIDTLFNPEISGDPNAYVYSLALQADGKILVGGLFQTLGGLKRSNIGRLNADGTTDVLFNPGANRLVESLGLQADGKVLVGGSFPILGGQARGPFERLNATETATQNHNFNGSSITWLRSGSCPEVWRTTFEASSDGARWTPLGSGTRVTGGWQLSGISLPPHSSIRARGFTTGGLNNGSSWFLETIMGAPGFLTQPAHSTNSAGSVATFSLISGGDEPIRFQWRKDGVDLVDADNISGSKTPILTVRDVLKVDEGGYSVVLSNNSGSATSMVANLTVIEPAITGQPASQHKNAGENAMFHVTAAGTGELQYQWRKDGTNLLTATEATLSITNLQESDAGLYNVVASNASGVVTSSPVLLTVNMATLDAQFNPKASNRVVAFALQTDSKILLGGEFRSLGGEQRNRIGRLEADGSLDLDFNPEANGGLNCLAIEESGKIIAGGKFTILGGQARNRIARMNVDGTLDLDFNPGADREINSLLAQDQGKVLVGGSFRTLGEQFRRYLARLNANGRLDEGFDANLNWSVHSLAMQSDGKILAAGGSVARFNSNGTIDEAFNPKFNRSFYAIALQNDGKILVGSHFDDSSGQIRNLGRLNADGTWDRGFNPNPDSLVYSIVLQADGKILVGGQFAKICGEEVRYIARLNSDGTLDATFNPRADLSVISLALQADGKILVGGYFQTLAGQRCNYFGRLNATETAIQSLRFDGSSITWLRSGSCPEVWRTTFEALSDGAVWMPLGSGTRIEGGWQLTGISLPSNTSIRARGYTSGGWYNGSSWFVESRTE